MSVYQRTIKEWRSAMTDQIVKVREDLAGLSPRDADTDLAADLRALLAIYQQIARIFQAAPDERPDRPEPENIDVLCDLLGYLLPSSLNVYRCGFGSPLTRWFVAYNGSDQHQRIQPSASVFADVRPYYFAIWYNGHLAGLLNCQGEGTFAASAEATWPVFVEAIQTEVNRRRADGPSNGDAQDAGTDPD